VKRNYPTIGTTEVIKTALSWAAGFVLKPVFYVKEKLSDNK
jgi:hypothetical protein